MPVVDANGKEVLPKQSARLSGTVVQVVDDGPVGVLVEVTRGRKGKVRRLWLPAEALEVMPHD